MFKQLLLVLAIAFPATSYAEWEYWGTDEEYVSYLDAKRIVSTNDALEYVDAWVKMVIHTDLKHDGLSVGDYVLVKYSLKCKSHEIALTAAYNYQQKYNKNIGSDIRKNPKYGPVVPDSRGEALFIAACNGLFGHEY